MSSTLKYNDRNLVNSAMDTILQVIKPGDVVNQIGSHKWWQFWLAITHSAIQGHQKKLFGKDSNWNDTHTMLYLDEDNTFSVELPRATMKPLREYCLTNLSIYRLRLTDLNQDFIETLRKGAMDMVGQDYDIGQLLDIAINRLLGFDHQRRLRIFDFGRKKKVCSVGVRVTYEYLYQARIKTEDSRPGKWLFYELNSEKWSQKAVEKYRGTNVEATAPAHFANTDYFSNEFELIARFNEGKQLLPK